MKDLLAVLKGARLIARGEFGQEKVSHYLLPDSRVLEIVRTKRVPRRSKRRL